MAEMPARRGGKTEAMARSGFLRPGMLVYVADDKVRRIASVDAEAGTITFEDQLRERWWTRAWQWLQLRLRLWRGW